MVEVLILAMSNNNFWHEGYHYNHIRGVAMEAKYAHSVANLLMSQWGESSIFGQAIKEISLYKRYIDDIIIPRGWHRGKFKIFFNWYQQ